MGTSMMRSEDIITKLPCDTESDAMLESDYFLSNYGSQNSLCVTSKLTDVTVERVDGSLGITLRGGLVPDNPHLSRPLIITQIRKNGSAHRTGLIRVGDRLLKVDHHSLINKTLLEAQQILKECTKDGSRGTNVLTIEYDVSVMESVKYANGPLLLEIERQGEEEFGVTVGSCCEADPDEELFTSFYIESITPASTADRCGALSAGDRLLAVDEVPLKGWRGTPMDVQRLLSTATRLQVIPAHAMARRAMAAVAEVTGRGQYATCQSPSSFSTWSSRRSRLNKNNRLNRQSTMITQKTFDTDCSSTYSSYPTSFGGVSHSETLSITLTSDRGVGYGLEVAIGDHGETRSADILISWIVPDSPAYRSGCLQVGDRIIAVNHQPTLTLQEINSILKIGDDPTMVSKITLEVEFDVADAVVPSSGIFTVKVARRGPGLGITVTASKTRPEDPFTISEVLRGSPAHRTGTLRAGDRLLAIDGRPLNEVSGNGGPEASPRLTRDGEVVALRVEKPSASTQTAVVQKPAKPVVDEVIYTVELRRGGGPLGITVSGSEDCVEPVVLSRLTEGGLAEKTGALHVGDRILAINGESLEHKPLSEAIRLLQTPTDRVQLKIARTIKYNNTQSPSSFSSKPLPCSYSSESMWDNEIYHVTLYKDSVYDDYGFSVSDGLYEKGVYVNRIRKGGPADIVGLLKPYDRIIQVNDTKTQDFDCCLTVPLIASAGDRIELVIARNPYMSYMEKVSFVSNQEISGEPNSTLFDPQVQNAGIDVSGINILANNRTIAIDKTDHLQEHDKNRPNEGKKVLYSTLMLKPIVYDLLQKVSPTVIMQGLHDKLKDIKLYWSHPNRPNFGGVQFASPEQIWEKLHEKGHNFLTGINGAIFGLAGAANHDYPFPYRSLNRESADD
ncbi:unnamed protein product [Callosobruchus maculatus]|uniref:PDZ domain-containing protein n=1 Tax=Callosobruchus maculatus TaxID=64391 RepID=A0A653DES8_CALMS|nr:unnamed protein product [Callosobruchus maculatus]